MNQKSIVIICFAILGATSIFAFVQYQLKTQETIVSCREVSTYSYRNGTGPSIGGPGAEGESLNQEQYENCLRDVGLK